MVSSQEDSNATGVDGNEADNSASSSEAIYVFVQTDTSWKQTAYVKASNAEQQDGFRAVGLSRDGTSLVVGASGEDSGATGIGGDSFENSLSRAGAVYLY